nr:DUF6544 family protein [Azoarcus taiwanensis]
MLPGPGIAWEVLGKDTARVTVTHNGLSQSVDVSVDEEGRPVEVRFQRWTNANAERTYRLQPFGGYLSDFREIQGFRLPFRVEAGNLFGTDAYFPFFKARLRAVRFPS